MCGGLSHSSLYRLIKAGEFPKPVVLSRNRHGQPARVAFLESELGEWIAAKVRAHRGAAAA